MARGQETATARVLLDGQQADKELQDLRKKASQLRKELKAKLQIGDADGVKKIKKELSDTDAQLLKMRKSAWDLNGVLKNLSGASLRDLEKAQRDLTNQVRHASRATEEERKALKMKADQLKAVKTQIQELKVQNNLATGSNKSFMASLGDGFNRYFGLVTSIIASVTGTIIGFKKLSEEVAKLDDVYSDVMKTTGMTRDEVVSLNEELKKFDTRTSRESLNNLARDAGKLGLESRQDILDFVEAGNQINVALGEDLGEDAIKNIGKMVGVYKDASNQLQGIGLKEQMLAVGSALNEIGASSSASEPYLVDFAGRLGGISKQAKISIADILGYASALDQDMQAVEMSATAFQNFIMKLMGDPAKFAKLAGLEVKSFTELLNNDVNAAIKQVLTSLNEKGGFQELIPIFEEMGLDGARATGVLSAMAGSIDKINTAQAISNKAMLDGVSITNEYNIKNNNLQAQLDKARKNFYESSIALGEKLGPALVHSTNSFSYLIKLLTALPDFIRRNNVLFTMLAGATLTLLAAKLKLNAASLVEILTLKTGIGLKIKDEIVLRALIVQESYRNALIGKTTVLQKAAAISTTTLRTAMAALGGPIGVVIMGLTGLMAAIKFYDKNNSESLRLESNKEERLKSITKTSNNLTTAYNAQQQSVSQLNSLNRDQIDNLRKITEATLKQAEADLLGAKIKQAITREENDRVGLWDRFVNQITSFNNNFYAAEKNAKDATENGKKAASEFDDQINTLSQTITNLKNQHKDVTDVLNAEAKADSIVAKSVSQYEEKARLLSVALKTVNKDSEDYTRIQNKINAINKELSKKPALPDDNTDTAVSNYKKLSQSLSDTKDQMIEFVMAGDLERAMELQKTVDYLERVLQYVNEIVAAGGDLTKVLSRTPITAMKPITSITGNIPDAGTMQPRNQYSSQYGQQETSKWDEWSQSDRLNFAIDSAQTIADAEFNIIQQKNQREYDAYIENLNRQREAELSNKNLTEAQKDAINKKYEAKELAARRQAARRQYQADLAQAWVNMALSIGKAAVNAWPVPAIPMMAAAGIAGGAQIATIMRNKPSFYEGGDTGPGIGIEDSRGTVAGIVHANEYVIPEWMRGMPQVIAFERVMEGIRTGRQLASGGSVSAAPAGVVVNSPAPQVITQSDPALLAAINKLNSRLDGGIKTNFSIFDFDKFQQKVDDIESISSF